MKQPGILISVPCMGMVHAEFAHCLSMATANMVAQGIRTNCSFYSGSIITSSRRNLVETFLKSDLDYMLWIDSDIKFPIDTPVRLLKRNKKIVGCNYRKRRFPNPSFTAMKKVEGKYVEFKTEAKSPGLEVVDILPHGMVLIEREVYEKVSKPYYLLDYDQDTKTELGEDVYFFEKAKNAGFEIWCDQDLSREISHIGTFYFNYNLSQQC